MMRRTLLCLAALALPALGYAAGDESTVHAALIVGASPSESLVRGAGFGAEEARRTAALLGRDFRLEVLSAKDAASAAKTAATLHERGVALIAGGVDGEVAATLAANGGSVVAILSGDSDGGKSVWRINPPPARYAELLRDGGTRAGKPLRVTAWHPSLTRYGAGELNERFTAATGAAMDEEAWFGWLAVKLVAEAAFRNRSIGEMRLDGHKGVLLRFDEQRRLVQPLYTVFEREGKEIALYD